jgi:hypothetical protein
MPVSTQMLPDGSNSEAIGPDPLLEWSDKADLKDAVVLGPVFSQATTKSRMYFVFAGVPYKHEQHLKAKPQGMKPDASYQKVSEIDVGRRQVNNNGIILQNLLLASGIKIDKA